MLLVARFSGNFRGFDTQVTALQRGIAQKEQIIEELRSLLLQLKPAGSSSNKAVVTSTKDTETAQGSPARDKQPTHGIVSTNDQQPSVGADGAPVRNEYKHHLEELIPLLASELTNVQQKVKTLEDSNEAYRIRISCLLKERSKDGSPSPAATDDNPPPQLVSASTQTNINAMERLQKLPKALRAAQRRIQSLEKALAAYKARAAATAGKSSIEKERGTVVPASSQPIPASPQAEGRAAATAMASSAPGASPAGTTTSFNVLSPEQLGEPSPQAVVSPVAPESGGGTIVNDSESHHDHSPSSSAPVSPMATAHTPGPPAKGFKYSTPVRALVAKPKSAEQRHGTTLAVESDGGPALPHTVHRDRWFRSRSASPSRVAAKVRSPPRVSSPRALATPQPRQRSASRTPLVRPLRPAEEVTAHAAHGLHPRMLTADAESIRDPPRPHPYVRKPQTQAVVDHGAAPDLRSPGRATPTSPAPQTVATADGRTSVYDMASPSARARSASRTATLAVPGASSPARTPTWHREHSVHVGVGRLFHDAEASTLQASTAPPRSQASGVSGGSSTLMRGHRSGEGTGMVMTPSAWSTPPATPRGSQWSSMQSFSTAGAQQGHAPALRAHSPKRASDKPTSAATYSQQSSEPSVDPVRLFHVAFDRSGNRKKPARSKSQPGAAQRGRARQRPMRASQRVPVATRNASQQRRPSASSTPSSVRSSSVPADRSVSTARHEESLRTSFDFEAPPHPNTPQGIPGLRDADASMSSAGPFSPRSRVPLPFSGPPRPRAPQQAHVVQTQPRPSSSQGGHQRFQPLEEQHPGASATATPPHKPATSGKGKWRFQPLSPLTPESLKPGGVQESAVAHKVPAGEAPSRPPPPAAGVPVNVHQLPRAVLRKLQEKALEQERLQFHASLARSGL